MFDLTDIKQLHMETSSACNAACPMCPRETSPHFNKKTDAVFLSLDKVKTLFDDDFIRQLDSMYMCGNYGDPASAPETIGIFNHFRTVNNNMSLGIHSNGGLRSMRWWSELGAVLSREADYCYFGIDGLADTNHIYRVNTDFTKIMRNAAAFIKAGGKAHWEYLVFEHNEHQIEEARKMSQGLGFTGFRTKVSRRFDIVTTNLRPPKGTL